MPESTSTVCRISITSIYYNKPQELENSLPKDEIETFLALCSVNRTERLCCRLSSAIGDGSSGFCNGGS